LQRDFGKLDSLRRGTPPLASRVAALSFELIETLQPLVPRIRFSATVPSPRRSSAHPTANSRHRKAQRRIDYGLTASAEKLTPL
jgi:hypothetical protein